MKNRFYFPALASMLALLVASSNGTAEIVLSNIDLPYQVGLNVRTATSSNHFIVAQSFTTGSSIYRLDSVTLALATNSQGTGELRVRTNRPSQNIPDGLVEFLGSQTIDSSNDAGLVTWQAGVFGNAAVLNPNTTYWLTLGENSPVGSLQWTGTFTPSALSSAGWQITNQAFYSDNNGFSWTPYEIGPPNESARFLINATAIPEPSSGLLVASWVVGILLRRRRTRTNVAPRVAC